MVDRATVVIAIKPVSEPSNAFVGAFSDSLRHEGFQVVSFDWGSLASRPPDVAILHWPYELTGLGGLFSGLWRLVRLYGAIAFARRKGMRLVWVAHNAQPHESGRASKFLMRRFVGKLDGIIHLSEYSRALIHRTYRVPPRIREVITVHGHYLASMATRPTPPRPLGDRVKLAYFGQVRRYKNLEALAAGAATVGDDGVDLTITGRKSDAGLVGEIEGIAAQSSNIVLDLRDSVLPDAEIEAAIDAADGIVLPYRAILNSGAALFALSRARPILAPRMGSLPELQAIVGDDWVRLCDGEIDAAALRDFAAWLRSTPRSGAPILSALDWSLVGRDVASLVDQLVVDKQGGR